MAAKSAAASKNGPRRKLALVIGIGKYSDGQNLLNAENDAIKTASALRDIGFLIYEDEPKLNLTREEMRLALVSFEESLKEGDIIVFYFAGHGRQWEDQNYLIPTDNTKEVTENGVTVKVRVSGSELKDHAINAQDILTGINKKKTFVTIFFLDCCRTYHLRNDELTTRSQIEGDSHPQGFRSMAASFGSIIVFACAPGTVASDGKKGDKNGLFTKHLLEHVKTPNKDIYTLITNVTCGVHDESNTKQIPYFTGSLRHPNICLNEQDFELKEQATQIMGKVKDKANELTAEVKEKSAGTKEDVQKIVEKLKMRTDYGKDKDAELAMDATRKIQVKHDVARKDSSERALETANQTDDKTNELSVADKVEGKSECHL